MSYTELTNAVADLAANAPTGPVPTQVPTASGPTAVGYGGIVVGIAVGAFVAAKWKHVNKDSHMMFILGVVVAVLLGTGTGLLGSLSDALRDTGNSVGSSITDTTNGQR